MVDCDSFFNANLPECQEPAADEKPEAEEKDMSEMDQEWADVTEYMEGAKMDMMMANLAFLSVALGGAVHTALDLFMWKFAIVDDEDEVYHYADEYDLSEDYDTMMLWEMGGMIGTWGSFVVHAILTVTQLLSMVGVMGEINLMAWGYGPMIMELLSVVVGVMWFIQYNNAYAILRTDVDDNDDVTDTEAAGVASGIWWDALEMSVMQASAILTLWMNMETWMMAQWWALPEETKKQMWMDMKESEKKDDDMKKMLLRKAIAF